MIDFTELSNKLLELRKKRDTFYAAHYPDDAYHLSQIEEIDEQIGGLDNAAFNDYKMIPENEFSDFAESNFYEVYPEAHSIDSDYLRIDDYESDLRDKTIEITYNDTDYYIWKG